MNWNSIISQAEASIKTSKRQSESKEIAFSKINGSSATAEKAARKFIEVLKSVVEAKGSAGYLGSTAISAATSLVSSEPYKAGDYIAIDINFSGDLFRASLVPGKYDGVDNIVALLNNGYDTGGKHVYGMWHGKPYRSLTYRNGAHFIQEAVDEFNRLYASEYGVIEINVSNKYI